MHFHSAFHTQPLFLLSVVRVPKKLKKCWIKLWRRKQRDGSDYDGREDENNKAF
jgi:hypothetical protein